MHDQRIARLGLLLVAFVGLMAAAACEGTSDDGGGGGSVEVRTEIELAPVEDARIIGLDDAPTPYAVEVVTALPDGCHEFKDAAVRRDGVHFEVTVHNEVKRGDVACTQEFRTHTSTIELPGEFEQGVQYTVDVNDEVSLAFSEIGGD